MKLICKLIFLLMIVVTNSQNPDINTTGAKCPLDYNPTEKVCDAYNPPCLEILFCIQGQCSCPGDKIYSTVYCTCKIPAGGRACEKSKDCTDGAHCYHPDPECVRRRYGFYGGRTRCRQEATQCHCCEGSKLGKNGVCPSLKCVNGGSKLSGNLMTIWSSIFLIWIGVAVGFI